MRLALHQVSMALEKRKYQITGRLLCLWYLLWRQ